MVDTAGGISVGTGDIYGHQGEDSPMSAALHQHFSWRQAALEIQIGISISQGMLSPSPARTSLSSQMFYLTLVMLDFCIHVTLHLSFHMAFFHCFLTTIISGRRPH